MLFGISVLFFLTGSHFYCNPFSRTFSIVWKSVLSQLKDKLLKTSWSESPSSHFLTWIKNLFEYLKPESSHLESSHPVDPSEFSISWNRKLEDLFECRSYSGFAYRIGPANESRYTIDVRNFWKTKKGVHQISNPNQCQVQNNLKLLGYFS